MERKFIKSGIPGLDERLGGGVLEGSIITLSGPTGAGKSSFAAQFLYSGAAESNEPGLYISIEESRKDFFFHMGGYSWDFASLERERKFILLDYPIHEVDQVVTQSSAIQEIINTTGVRRVVIDSIMPVALYFKSDEERKVGFIKLIENLRKWNTTILILSEDLKMNHAGSRPNSEYGIESFTDGWINIFYSYDDKKHERARYLEIVKMKGVHHSTMAHKVSLDDDGFTVIGDESNEPAPAKKSQMAPGVPAARGEKPKMKTLMMPVMAEAEEQAQTDESAGKRPAGGKQSGQTKPAPAKMTPALAARLAETKKKLMKKK